MIKNNKSKDLNKILKLYKEESILKDKNITELI